MNETFKSARVADLGRRAWPYWLWRGVAVLILLDLAVLAAQNATAPSLVADSKTSIAVIDVNDRGFSPKTLNFPAGRVLIHIHSSLNQRQSLQWDLTRDVATAGLPAGKIQSLPERATQRKIVHALDLAPGVYTLRELNHPQWICRIEVK